MRALRGAVGAPTMRAYEAVFLTGIQFYTIGDSERIPVPLHGPFDLRGGGREDGSTWRGWP